MMMSPERKAWLDNLKPGDEVAVNYKRNYQTSPHWKIHRVKNRTPKGRLRLDNQSEILLREDGSWSETYGWFQIVPVTDEIRKWIHRETLLKKAREILWNDMPTEQLQRVVALAYAKGFGDF